MEILSSAAAAAFEAAHELDLYHYEDALTGVISEELHNDISMAKGVFAGTFKNPDFVAESTVSKDRFLLFVHEEQHGVLALSHGTATLYIPPALADEVRIAWLTAFAHKYLYKHNPDNVACIPSAPVVVKKTRKAAAKKEEGATKVKKPKAAKPKTAKPKAAKTKKEAS